MHRGGVVYWVQAGGRGCRRGAGGTRKTRGNRVRRQGSTETLVPGGQQGGGAVAHRHRARKGYLTWRREREGGVVCWGHATWVPQTYGCRWHVLSAEYLTLIGGSQSRVCAAGRASGCGLWMVQRACVLAYLGGLRLCGLLLELGRLALRPGAARGRRGGIGSVQAVASTVKAMWW